MRIFNYEIIKKIFAGEINYAIIMYNCFIFACDDGSAGV